MVVMKKARSLPVLIISELHCTSITNTILLLIQQHFCYFVENFKLIIINYFYLTVQFYNVLSCLRLVAEAGHMCHFSGDGDGVNVKFLHLALFLRMFKC